MQSRLDSILEAVTNVVIGFSINFIANLTLFPLFGWEITVLQNVGLGVCYTIISLVRSYSLRRLFTGRSPYQAIRGSIQKRVYGIVKNDGA